MWRTDLLERTLMLGKIEGGGEGDYRRWDGWIASATRWTWVWASSGSWWWTGKLCAAVYVVAKSQTWLSDWTELMITWAVAEIITVIVTSISSLFWLCTSLCEHTCLNMASLLIKREWREHSEKKLEDSLLIATWVLEKEEMGFEGFGKGSSDWQWELR